MPDNVKRTPSYLKGLAETRARAAGDVARYQKLHAEIGEKLQQAERTLAAADDLIRKFDSRLDPTRIAAIRGRDRYGKRGTLKATILDYLKQANGEAVTTSELAIVLIAKFGLEFVNAQDRRRWVRDGMGNRLREMARTGEIERLHLPEATSEMGRWRWNPGEASLEELRAKVEAQGGTVAAHDPQLEEPASD
jgi:hypothetical protein